MALDINKIKNKLSTLKNDRDSLLWKPKPGKYNVRIVPYKYDVANPFVELYFHYIDKKTILSPRSFGKPDPIYKFAQELQKTGNKEDWKKGKNIEPKLRTYAPVLVRGEEDKGVRFWGFGKTVYNEILSIIAHEDFGDITDMQNGRDLEVEIIDAKTIGKQFNETRVRPRGKQTPATTDPVVLQAIKSQRNVLEAWQSYSYEEIQEIWENHLNGVDPTDNAEAESALPEITEAVKDIFGDAAPKKEETAQPKPEQQEAAQTTPHSPTAPAPVAIPDTKPAQPQAPVMKDAQSIANEFDKLFGG